MGEVSPRTCAGCLAQLLLKVLRSLRWETARISLSGQTQEDQNNTLSGHRVPYLSRELFGDKMNRGSHLRPEKSHVELLSVPWHLLGMRGVPSLETGLSPSSPSCPAPGELLPQHVLEMLFHPWPWLFPLLDPWPFPPENWSHFVITPSLIWLFLWRLHPHETRGSAPHCSPDCTINTCGGRKEGKGRGLLGTGQGGAVVGGAVTLLSHPNSRMDGLVWRPLQSSKLELNTELIWLRALIISKGRQPAAASRRARISLVWRTRPTSLRLLHHF